jgi:hypothetical protein
MVVKNCTFQYGKLPLDDATKNLPLLQFHSDSNNILNTFIYTYWTYLIAICIGWSLFGTQCIWGIMFVTTRLISFLAYKQADNGPTQFHQVTPVCIAAAKPISVAVD